MAEQDGDKTEAPTPRKRQEAREQGRTAKSQDLVAASLLLASIVLLGWTGEKLFVTLREITHTLLSADFFQEFDAKRSLTMLWAPAWMIAQALAPLMLGLMFVAILVNVIQVGLHPNLGALQPKFAALNPMNGFSKLFSGGRGMVNLGFNLLKLTIVSLVAYSAVAGRIWEIINIAQQSHLQIAMLTASVVYDITFRIAMVLLILAILDYAWQKFRFERDLRMTKQEVKDEMKRMEGDPIIKQRRRQIQMQRAMQRIQKDVPKADVVITNPTHFAVALEYNEDNMSAPKVVAKGADFLAQKIRQIASEHGIPIIERPPLARALYKDCKVGQDIPQEFYAAVAEILAYVYELTGRRQAVRRP